MFTYQETTTCYLATHYQLQDVVTVENVIFENMAEIYEDLIKTYSKLSKTINTKVNSFSNSMAHFQV